MFNRLICLYLDLSSLARFNGDAAEAIFDEPRSLVPRTYAEHNSKRLHFMAEQVAREIEQASGLTADQVFNLYALDYITDHELGNGSVTVASLQAAQRRCERPHRAAQWAIDAARERGDLPALPAR